MNKRRLARSLRRAERLCKQRGVRLTTHRRTILELICAADKPISAYDLLDLMRSRIKKPAPPTVYRALDFLVKEGLVHKLESLHAFVGCTHPEHTHAGQFLICANCGDVSEMADESIESSLRSAEKAAGFTTNRPIVELLGTCAHCAEKRHG